MSVNLEGYGMLCMINRLAAITQLLSLTSSICKLKRNIHTDDISVSIHGGALDVGLVQINVRALTGLTYMEFCRS